MIIFESTFPEDYREEEIKKILDFVTTGKFCQVISVPGAGKATVLRLLAHNRGILKHHLGEKEKTLRFEYLNLHRLENYDEISVARFILGSISHELPEEIDAVLVTKKLHEFINNLAQESHTMVFLLDHFDEFQNQLPRSFFQMLRDLSSLAKYKFAVAFATRRDLKDLIDPEIMEEFYDFFVDNVIFLSIGDEKATEFLFGQLEEVFGQKIGNTSRKKINAIAGGHAKLTKVICELSLREKVELVSQILLKKPLVTATVFELWNYLTAREQIALQNMVNNKTEKDDQSLATLRNFTLINSDNNLTVPIFAEFIKTVVPSLESAKITYDIGTKEIKKGQEVISDLLSPQEYRLLKFMVENQGKVSRREDIIDAVWPDVKVSEGISDEAIDQMVFRLRKKIENEPNSPRHIVTIKGQGWRFSS